MVSFVVWDHEAQVRFLLPRPVFGGLVIMGAHVLCKHEVGVRFSYPPPSIKMKV